MLFQEGRPCLSAFIIKEGDVLLQSSKNPVAGRVERQCWYPTNRGYMSKTLSSYKFGLKSNKEWIAEDILILKDEDPMPYCAVAQTKVVVLEI